MPESVVLLGRLAVAQSAQGLGLGALLVAAAREIAGVSLTGTGGAGWRWMPLQNGRWDSTKNTALSEAVPPVCLDEFRRIPNFA